MNTKQEVYCGDCLVLISQCGHGYDLRHESNITSKTVDNRQLSMIMFYQDQQTGEIQWQQ